MLATSRSTAMVRLQLTSTLSCQQAILAVPSTKVPALQQQMLLLQEILASSLSLPSTQLRTLVSARSTKIGAMPLVAISMSTTASVSAASQLADALQAHSGTSTLVNARLVLNSPSVLQVTHLAQPRAHQLHVAFAILTLLTST